MRVKRTIKRGLTFAVQRLVEAMEGVELRASRQQSVMADLVNERDWLLKRNAVLEEKLKRPFMDHFLDPAHTLVWPSRDQAGEIVWNASGPQMGSFNGGKQEALDALEYNMQHYEDSRE